ncbi:flagellar protein FlaG [Thermomonas sp.]|uniref:flagellar protein FlaG n=2 Tax=unclassified Thermomonas TaxID=2633315 RepID=UPI001ACF34FB|nr:flagellar protein FlaG [Stenotrophomonas nitritireducens]
MSSIASVNASLAGAPATPTPTAGVSARADAGPPMAPSDAPAKPDAASAASAVIDSAQAADRARKQRAAQELQKQIDQAMAQSRTRTSLRFRVEEDVGKIVVSVVDENGKTLMQIPDDTALALARRLAETGSGLVDRQA